MCRGSSVQMCTSCGPTHRQGYASVCLRVVRNEGACSLRMWSADLGRSLSCCGAGSWLEGLVAGWARLLFRMARDLCSAAHAQVAQMFGFRMQFLSVHVSLRRRWGQVAC